MKILQTGARYTLFTVSLCLLATTAVWADKLHCTFNEPYLDFTYDSEKATLTSGGLDRETRLFAGVGLEVTGVNTLRLAWQDQGARRLELTIDYQGSDLMSDQVFPYSVRYFSNEQVSKPLHGGCTSEHLKKIIPADEVE